MSMMSMTRISHYLNAATLKPSFLKQVQFERKCKALCEEVENQILNTPPEDEKINPTNEPVYKIALKTCTSAETIHHAQEVIEWMCKELEQKGWCTEIKENITTGWYHPKARGSQKPTKEPKKQSFLFFSRAQDTLEKHLETYSSD